MSAVSSSKTDSCDLEAWAGTVDFLSAADERLGAFSRVIPNGEGSDFLFTLQFPQGTDSDAIEVTTGSLDNPGALPITKNFGTEARLPWIDLLTPGRVPDSPTTENTTRVVVSRQHPDHDTPSADL